MSNTPQNDNNCISLDIISNNKNRYSLNISNNSDSYLEIEIKSIDNVSNLIYIQKYTLDILKKLCKYFMMCESIEDVICSIKPLINNSNLIEKMKKLIY